MRGTDAGSFEGIGIHATRTTTHACGRAPAGVVRFAEDLLESGTLTTPRSDAVTATLLDPSDGSLSEAS